MAAIPSDEFSVPATPAEALLAEYLARTQAGEIIELDAWCDQHPAHADEIRRIHAELLDANRALNRTPTPPVDSGAGNAPSSSESSEAFLDRLREHRSTSDRYLLKGEIARGGMGAILRVWDEDLRRHLAMKVILGRGHAPVAGDTPVVRPEVLSRFLEEAQVTGQLDHPGIVPVHELGLDASGRVYFTMRLVKGRDFEQVIRDVHAKKEDWTLTRAVGLLLKACEAIAFAHSRGVIHRDLKPANLMTGRFGEVYVMDWGLARVRGREDTRDLRIREDVAGGTGVVETDRRDEGASPLLTMDGDVLGTPAYMSPEQARGDLDRMGPASDVYSMGAILYHLLTNQRPYVAEGTRAAPTVILGRVREGSPPRPSDLTPGLPVELAAVCEKAMSREAEHRYADVEELAEDIRSYLEDRVVRAHRGGALLAFRKWIRRNRAAAMTAAAALVVLGMVGVISVLGIVGQRDRAVAAEERAETAFLRVAADWQGLTSILGDEKGANDPWRVVEELCVQQHFPAALALATGSSGPDTVRLPDYVREWREWVGNADELRRQHDELRVCERLTGAERKLQVALDRVARISLPDDAPRSLVVRQCFIRGYSLWGLGEFRDATVALGDVTKMARDLGWREVEYHALRGAVHCAWQSWNFKVALESGTALVTLSEQRNRMDLVADAEGTVGGLYRLTGDFGAAVEHLGRAVEIYTLLPGLSPPDALVKELEGARRVVELRERARRPK